MKPLEVPKYAGSLPAGFCDLFKGSELYPSEGSRDPILQVLTLIGSEPSKISFSD